MSNTAIEYARIDELNKFILQKALGTLHVNESSIIPFVLEENNENEKIKEEKDMIVAKISEQILATIQRDVFEDGEISQSEQYMLEKYNDCIGIYIKEALMQIYLDYYANEHVLNGVLTMISAKTYEDMEPQGQIIALGLLQHKDVYVRDKAIQVFERWNSKKGIHILENLHCDQQWLQNYVNKVIKYLKRDGVE